MKVNTVVAYYSKMKINTVVAYYSKMKINTVEQDESVEVSIQHN